MQPGEKIDDFSALDQHGSTVRLSQTTRLPSTSSMVSV